MVNVNPQATDADAWRAGDPLDFAWFGHAPKPMVRQFREAGGSPGRSATLRRMMEAEVRVLLSVGDLAAFGIQTEPSPEIAPRRIPVAFFEAQSVAVEWEVNRVCGLGRVFCEVRVCPAEIATRGADVSRNSETDSKGRGGRNSQYPQAREILAELHKVPGYRVMAAERLADRFNRAYQEKFSTPDRTATPISVRSLRSHLKRYRQELAETGKN